MYIVVTNLVHSGNGLDLVVSMRDINEVLEAEKTQAVTGSTDTFVNLPAASDTMVIQ